jgi:hypothetical protein
MLLRAPLLTGLFLAFASITQLGVAQDPGVPLAKPTIEEIKVDFTTPPTRATGNDRILTENWVVVAVKFSTPDSIPFVDSLTMKVYIDGLEDPGKKGFTVLDSQVTFVNVTPSREHFARFYISPTTALRYGGPGGKGFRQSNVFVSLAIGSEEPVIRMMREDKNPLWYQQGRTVADMLLPFYDSPWWPSEATLYQQFKKR